MEGKTVQRKFVSIRGNSLAYLESGTSGPAVVFLHGLVDRSDRYTDLIGSLDKQARCYALDLRGHGHSSWSASYRVADLAGDLVEFLDTVVRGPAILAGHSLGGITSIAACALQPRGIRAMLLEDAAFYTIGTTDPDELGIRAAFPQWKAIHEAIALRKGEELSAIAAWLSTAEIGGKPFGQTANPEELEWAVRCFLLADPTIMECYLPGGNCGFEPRKISHVTCPLTLLHGSVSKGSLWSESSLARFRREKPDARVIAVPSAGHHVLTAEPEIYERALRDLLQQV